MARNLAYRRHAETLSKARAKVRVEQWGHAADAARIGRSAHTPHPCSGPCCGNPRRWLGAVTVQERRAPQVLDSNWH